jgi:hypothetical protein
VKQRCRKTIFGCRTTASRGPCTSVLQMHSCKLHVYQGSMAFLPLEERSCCESAGNTICSYRRIPREREFTEYTWEMCY